MRPEVCAVPFRYYRVISLRSILSSRYGFNLDPELEVNIVVTYKDTKLGSIINISNIQSHQKQLTHLRKYNAHLFQPQISTSKSGCALDSRTNLNPPFTCNIQLHRFLRNNVQRTSLHLSLAYYYVVVERLNYGR